MKTTDVAPMPEGWRAVDFTLSSPMVDTPAGVEAFALRAFEAAPDQGVTYAMGVWHHGLAALDAPARFVVCMSFSGQEDDVFVPLARPITLLPMEGA